MASTSSTTPTNQPRTCATRLEGCSSYKAEIVAIKHALEWIVDSKSTGRFLLCTDSRSAVQRLNSGPSITRTALEKEIWDLLIQISDLPNSSLHFQWIPSHCDIQGNEIADKLANEGRLLPQEDVAIDLKTAVAIAKRYIIQTEWKSKLTHHSQPGGIRPAPARDKELGLTRRERVVLAQLRGNAKCPLLQAYLFEIKAVETAACLTCGHVPDDLSHMLFHCPHSDRHRHMLTVQSSDVLWEQPKEVIQFLHASGRMPLPNA